MATRYQKFIGGLLGEDVEGMSEEERKKFSREGTTSAILGLLGGSGLLGGLGAYGEQREAKRKKSELEARKKAAEDEMSRIAGRLFGEDLGARVITPEEAARMGNPKLAGTIRPRQQIGMGEEPDTGELSEVSLRSRYIADPQDALRRMIGTQAGRDVAAGMPDLFKLAQEGVTGRTVGDSVYNPLTGQFSKAPKEKSKTLTREEIAKEGLPRGTVAQYDANGNLKIVYEPKVAAPAAGTISIPGVGAVKLTQGEQQRDKDFAKGWTEFSARGGFADTAKQLEQLQDVLTRLESGKDLTGAFTGFIMQTAPSIANAFMAGKVSAREAVEEVVQRNLRMVLGPQFTKEEGDKLIARAYNPSLGEEENAIRLTRLIRQILSAASSTQKAGEYFDKFGTLKGYNAKIPSFADFNVTGDDKAVDLGEVPSGIDPRDWQYMTPEQRALWK